MKETERYLAKVGISLGDLDGLSVIHVAGTKGKVRSLPSSTSANLDSILTCDEIYCKHCCCCIN